MEKSKLEKDLERAHNKAKRLITQGRDEEAVDFLKKHLEKHPYDVKSLLKLASYYMQPRDVKKGNQVLFASISSIL